jgi:hypothetical protein
MPYDSLNNEPFDADEVSADIEDAIDDEFEEITSEEVDRVIEALDQLIQTVESENIRWHLEEAPGAIFSLIYDEDVEDETSLDSEAA